MTPLLFVNKEAFMGLTEQAITPACAALREFMAADKRRTQRWLASAMDVSQSAVSVWLKGKSRPAVWYCIALQYLTGIPVEWWVSEEERRVMEGIPATAQASLDRGSAPDPRQIPFEFARDGEASAQEVPVDA